MTAMPSDALKMPAIQTPEGFLAECHKRGIKLTAKDGTIKASGKPPANPEKFAAFLKAKKPELLALLQSTDALLQGTPLPVATEEHSEGSTDRKGPKRPDEAGKSMTVPEVGKVHDSPSTVGNPMDLSESGKSHGASVLHHEAALELHYAGPKLQAVAEGKVLVKWDTDKPVRVSQGVTTDDPERWFRLAWGRWCALWHLVHAKDRSFGEGGEIEGQRLRDARARLETLTLEMIAVLGEGSIGEASELRPLREQGQILKPEANTPENSARAPKPSPDACLESLQSTANHGMEATS